MSLDENFHVQKLQKLYEIKFKNVQNFFFSFLSNNMEIENIFKLTSIKKKKKLFEK